MEFIEVVSPDQAEKEVTAWLNRKKIFPSRREKLKDMVETIQESIVYGVLSIEDSGRITQKLLFPIKDTEGAEVLSELVFKPRVETSEVNRRIAESKDKSQQGTLDAWLSCLTDQSKGMLDKLDSVDKRVSESIGVFFI